MMLSFNFLVKINIFVYDGDVILKFFASLAYKLQ